MKVEARAPTRVDLAGGTVDIWPLYLFHPGSQTVNIAIRRYATCEVTTRADRRIVLVSQDQQVREGYESLIDPTLKQSKLPLLRELVMFFEPRRGIKLAHRFALDPALGRGEKAHLSWCQSVHVSFRARQSGSF